MAVILAQQVRGRLTAGIGNAFNDMVRGVTHDIR